MNEPPAQVQPRIAVVGGDNIYLVVRAPRLPAHGETLLGRDCGICAGTKGADQAIYAARLGAAVTMVACVGDDALGAALFDGQAAGGIEPVHPYRLGSTVSGIAMITVGTDGANTIAVAPGANARFAPIHFDAARDHIAGSDMLVRQVEVPLGTVGRAIGITAQHGIPVVRNRTRAHALSDELYAQADFLIVKETEAEPLTNAAVCDATSARAAASALHTKGARRERGGGDLIRAMRRRYQCDAQRRTKLDPARAKVDSLTYLRWNVNQTIRRQAS